MGRETYEIAGKTIERTNAKSFYCEGKRFISLAGALAYALDASVDSQKVRAEKEKIMGGKVA